MRIKEAPDLQQTCRDSAPQGSQAYATRRSKCAYNMPRRVLLLIAGMLLISDLVTDSPTGIKNAAYLRGAFAQESPPKGDLIKGEVKPYGELYVFDIRHGVGDRIIDGYNAQRGDKIRLLDFDLTDFNRVRGMLRQVGGDAQLRLPGGQILWILKTQIGSLGANTFQLQLDRRGLVPTFADEFNEFSWYAEGLNDHPTGGGTWRTNFGYAPVQHLGSRTLGSNGELQVYFDRGFRGRHPRRSGSSLFASSMARLKSSATKLRRTSNPSYQITSTPPASLQPSSPFRRFTGCSRCERACRRGPDCGQPSGSCQRIAHGPPKSILLKFSGRSRPCCIPMPIARRTACILMLPMSFVFQTRRRIFIYTQSIGKKMKSDGISTASRWLAPPLRQTCTSQCISWQVFRSEDIGSVGPMTPPTSLLF